METIKLKSKNQMNIKVKDAIKDIKQQTPLTKVLSERRERFGLNIQPEQVDQKLKDVLSMDSHLFATLPIELLHEYLHAVVKWEAAIVSEIKKCRADSMQADYYYRYALRQSKYKQLKDPIGKSEKEKEERLLATNDELQKLEAQKLVARALYDDIEGADLPVRSVYYAIQRVLIKQESSLKNKPF
jgi:hypothetical protein